MATERKVILYFEREDTCPNCGCKKSLDIYTDKDKPINYQKILDQNNHEFFGNKTHVFSYMRCNNCGKEFFIDWTGLFPVATSMDKFKSFMNEYKCKHK